MARSSSGEQPSAAYAQLEKSGASAMLDTIDDAADLLESSPGDAAARRWSFGDGLWGIPVRDRK